MTSPDSSETEPTENRAILHQTDLAHSGQDAHTYRLPAIETTSNGTIVVAFDRRFSSVDDLPAAMDIVVKCSNDLGLTWRTTYCVNIPEAVGVGEPSLLFDQTRRRLFLFFLCAPTSLPPGVVKNSINAARNLQQFLIWSDDSGATWSKPVEITDSRKGTTWQTLVATSGHGIQLSSGRLLQPFAYTDASQATHIINLYSDDHGETWSFGTPIQSGVEIAVEPESSVVELKDTTVLQNIRPGPETRFRVVATSSDQGISFGPASIDLALPDPCINADIIRWDNVDTPGAPQDVLLFTNPANRHERRDLTLRLSFDNGRSWPITELICPGPAGYSTMAILSDGSVGLLYERAGERHVTFCRVNPEWLRNMTSAYRGGDL